MARMAYSLAAGCFTGTQEDGTRIRAEEAGRVFDPATLPDPQERPEDR